MTLPGWEYLATDGIANIAGDIFGDKLAPLLSELDVVEMEQAAIIFPAANMKMSLAAFYNILLSIDRRAPVGDVIAKHVGKNSEDHANMSGFIGSSIALGRRP